MCRPAKKKFRSPVNDPPMRMIKTEERKRGKKWPIIYHHHHHQVKWIHPFSSTTSSHFTLRINSSFSPLALLVSLVYFFLLLRLHFTFFFLVHLPCFPPFSCTFLKTEFFFSCHHRHLESFLFLIRVEQKKPQGIYRLHSDRLSLLILIFIILLLLMLFLLHNILTHL